MKVTINRVKKLAIALILLPLFVVVLLNFGSGRTSAAAVADEKATADFYAAKCKMCHGDKAQKFFDTDQKTDEQMVEVVLKGKKSEKPPNMPAFETKGVDAEQAKALVSYMKSLKP